MVVAAALDDLRVGRPLGRQDLAADVDERLDVRVGLALVLRLDVEDAALVLDVGVESGDHGRRDIVARADAPGRPPEPARSAPRRGAACSSLMRAPERSRETVYPWCNASGEPGAPDGRRRAAAAAGSSRCPAPAASSTRSLWTRRLTHVFGSTTLAVSTVLAAFMLGLAAGSLLLGRWADRHRERALRAYGLLEIAIGPTRWSPSALLLRGLERAYSASAPLLESLPCSSSSRSSCSPAPSSPCRASLMGGTLPRSRALVVGARTDRRPGGRLYAANTAGRRPRRRGRHVLCCCPRRRPRERARRRSALNVAAGLAALALGRPTARAESARGGPAGGRAGRGAGPPPPPSASAAAAARGDRALGIRRDGGRGRLDPARRRSSSAAPSTPSA